MLRPWWILTIGLLSVACTPPPPPANANLTPQDPTVRCGSIELNLAGATLQVDSQRVKPGQVPVSEPHEFLQLTTGERVWLPKTDSDQRVRVDGPRPMQAGDCPSWDREQWLAAANLQLLYTPEELLMQVELPPGSAVAFDMDDTLLFSTPAFTAGFKAVPAGVKDMKFWQHVNESDAGRSVVKPAGRKLLEWHRQRGDRVYIVTARKRPGSDTAKAYAAQVFGLKQEQIFFEPDGKSQRLADLDVKVFYGDSDSDITDAQAAGIFAVRVQRAPTSSYRDSEDRLSNYQPGKFGELIVGSSYH